MSKSKDVKRLARIALGQAKPSQKHKDKSKYSRKTIDVLDCEGYISGDCPIGGCECCNYALDNINEDNNG